jgi:hypothetical protein
MNWTWNIRSRDGAMNGLEFSRATTAGEFRRVLVHAAPAQISVEVVDDDGRRIVQADVDRVGEYSPMTLLDLADGEVHRSEVWPGEQHDGLLVLLSGGEVGVLQRWEHADDHSWWRWSVEFSNHIGRPADWAPSGQQLQR